MVLDQLPQLPEATRHEPIYQDPEKHPLRIGGIVVGLRPLYTAEEATTYADARVAHALAADRARAAPVASGEVAVLAMVTFTMLGDLMGDEAPPEAIEFAKELYPRIDEIQEFAPDNADVLRVAMTHLRAWMSGAHAPSEQPADLSIQAAGEREAFEAHMSDGGKWPKAVERNSRGEYLLASAASGWSTWQAAWAAARASLSTPASGEGWISVKDMMPPPDTNLLVVWGDHHAVDKAHTFAKWKHPSHTLGYLIQGHPGSHNDVTFWRPLPPAPTSPTEPAAAMGGE